MMHRSRGQKLREVFDSIEDPVWDNGPASVPLKTASNRYDPLKKISTALDKLI